MKGQTAASRSLRVPSSAGGKHGSHGVSGQLVRLHEVKPTRRTCRPQHLCQRQCQGHCRGQQRARPHGHVLGKDGACSREEAAGCRFMPPLGLCVDELLLHRPHGRAQALAVGALGLRRAALGRGLDVLRHLLLRGRGPLTGSNLPLLGAPRGRRPRDVRVGALARAGVVQPLPQEAAVERHVPAVVLGHLLEAPDEAWRQRGVARGGGQGADEADDLLGRGGGLPDAALEVVQELLTLVDAANRIEAGRRKAVGGAVDVVRNDDPRT
mmetsp:Transcript_70695/g.187908  ORF Transcript_70695/g.187908 Transcript_70695/m.187908 type:complete len:268 (-) Transcript_70695:1144-1947(-)